jgi:hypothetical protein
MFDESASLASYIAPVFSYPREKLIGIEAKLNIKP